MLLVPFGTRKTNACRPQPERVACRASAPSAAHQRAGRTPYPGLGYNGTMKKASAKRKFRRFTVVIEQDEDGYYVATVPSLPSCYTQARTLEELAPRIREVIALCLAEQDAPPMKFVALEQVEVSA